MPRHPIVVLDDQIRSTERRAAEEPDPIAVLIVLLDEILASEADPYLLTDVLIVGIAAAIAEKIPPQSRGDAAVGAVRLLRDQLRTAGAI